MQLAPVLPGNVSAIGGGRGLARDVLAGKRTLLMQRELSGVSVAIGCVLHVVLIGWLPQGAFVAGLACAG